MTGGRPIVYHYGKQIPVVEINIKKHGKFLAASWKKFKKYLVTWVVFLSFCSPYHCFCFVIFLEFFILFVFLAILSLFLSLTFPSCHCPIFLSSFLYPVPVPCHPVLVLILNLSFLSLSYILVFFSLSCSCSLPSCPCSYP